MNGLDKFSKPRYGAFELKAKYRRNMLLGTLFSSLLALTTVASAFLFTASDKVTIVIEKRQKLDTIIVVLDQKYEIIPVKPNSGGGYRPQLKADGSVIVMADDDELVDEEVRIYSLTDDYVFGLYDDTGSTESYLGDPGYGDGRDDYTIYPDPNQFYHYEKLPEMIYEFPPEYPRLAEIAGISGEVWIKALVDKDGSVRDAMVFVSSNSRAGFDEAALRAAYKCKYSPGLQNKRPVMVWVSYKVDFVCQGSL